MTEISNPGNRSFGACCVCAVKAVVGPIRRKIRRATPARVESWKYRVRIGRRIDQAVAHGEQCVLVFTMGKVAQTTVQQSIDRLPNTLALTAHVVTPEQVRRNKIDWREAGCQASFPAHYESGMQAYKRLIKPGHLKHIVTLVREPISCSMSAYFETLHLMWKRPDAYKAIPTERLIEDYHARHEVHSSRVTDFFDDTFFGATGIDVYREPFDPETKHAQVHQGGVGVQIMHHDLPNERKADLLAKFLDREPFLITDHNVAENKEYASAYRAFRDQIKFSDAYLDRMLGSKYAKHFFSEARLEELYKKYSS